MGFSRAFNTVVFGAAVTVFACGTQQAANPSPAAADPETSTVSLIDSRWMGLTPDQPHGWEEVDRRVTSKFQQFDLRPADETEVPFHCNGCAPQTVSLTAYAPGELDLTTARTGQSVTVDTEGDGFFTENRAEREATLTWQYADNAWATVTGRTTITTGFHRMVELARALRPVERTPIRLPISIATVPVHMPLAEVEIGRGRAGSRLEFAPCGRTDVGGTPPCMVEGEGLTVRILPDDGRSRYILVEDAIPMAIGGYDGLYNPGGGASGEQAAVRIAPRVLVVFDAGGPGPPAPSHLLKDILAGVTFAPDPANPETWPAVADWARSS